MQGQAAFATSAFWLPWDAKAQKHTTTDPVSIVVTPSPSPPSAASGAKVWNSAAAEIRKGAQGSNVRGEVVMRVEGLYRAAMEKANEGLYRTAVEMANEHHKQS